MGSLHSSFVTLFVPVSYTHLAVTVDLARQSIVDVPTVLLLVVAAVLLIRFRVNSTWLILGGAAVGLVLSAVQRTF